MQPESHEINMIIPAWHHCQVAQLTQEFAESWGVYAFPGQRAFAINKHNSNCHFHTKMSCMAQKTNTKFGDRISWEINALMLPWYHFKIVQLDQKRFGKMKVYTFSGPKTGTDNGNFSQLCGEKKNQLPVSFKLQACFKEF